MVLAAPPMTGAEYLTAAVLRALWQELDAAFDIELAESKCGVQDFLKRRNPAWNLVGRVHFNLAENRKDAEAPFRLPGHLHHAAVGARQGPASAARPGSARVCRRGQQGAPAVAASSGAAGGGELPLAEGHGGRGRDLPPAALDARRGLAALERRPATGERRGGGAHAGGMAGQSSAAPAGDRHGRRQGAVGPGPGRAARFPAWKSRSTANA